MEIAAVRSPTETAGREELDMRLQDVPEGDRTHFLSRLARYGVDQQQLRDEELIIREDTRLELSHRTRGAQSPRILKSRDIDEVRRWIGLPAEIERARYVAPAVTSLAAMPAALRPLRPSFGLDEVRRRVALREREAPTSPAAPRAVASPGALDLRVLRSEELEEVRAAARAYIRGDQRMVRAYKPLIEALYGEFQIAAWFYTKVVVKAGAVLQFGKGANVLNVWKLVIEDGGTVRSQGHLTVDCTQLANQDFTGPGLAGGGLVGPAPLPTH